MSNLTAYRHWNRIYWLIGALALISLLALEWRASVIERAIGQYLAWQNPGREKIGRRWQVEKQQLLAGTRLERISKELRSKEKQLQAIADFSALIRLVLKQNQQIIPASHFARLYDTLPFYMQPLIIPPDTLLMFRMENALESVLLNRGTSELEIIFLGQQSRVLRRISLNDAQIEILLNHGKQVVMDVQNDPEFESRVYNFQQFFEMLTALPAEVRQNFLRAMPALMEFAGPTTRIGISNKISDELVQVAVAPDAFRAYVYFIPEDWIIDLVANFEDDPSTRHEKQDIL